MEFAEWEPAYEAILADFGFDREADRRARDHLASLVDSYDLGPLQQQIEGAHVGIVGGGSDILADVRSLEDVDVIIAASVAAGALRAAGEDVDLMVTDLDKTPAVVRALTESGTPVAVHAHGDNIPLIREQVPRLNGSQVLGTTQTAPHGPVRNFGGFTDGDRAAFIADHLGAGRLSFPGWDLDDPSVGPIKHQKLQWAARLLHWLERRRDERFGLLDGRRDALALSWLA
jgi:uncharacterized Rossmann fold enzyme